MLTQAQRRNIELLRAKHGDDKVVNAILKKIDDYLMDSASKAAEMRETGLHTELAISQAVAHQRTEVHAELDKLVDTLAERTERLTAKAKRTLPAPEHTLPDNERRDLINHFRDLPRSEQRRLTFELGEHPRLATALASINPQDAALFGLTSLTIERSAAIAHGGKFNPATGSFDYPNAVDHQNLQRAQDLHISASRLAESFTPETQAESA